MKKVLLCLLLLLFLVPAVFGAEIGDAGNYKEKNSISFPDMGKVVVLPLLNGVTGFANEFVTDLFSKPINPLLSWFEALLGHKPDFEPLKSMWDVMRYIISIFYGLFLLFSGLKFIMSSSDPVGRDKAKTMLKNVVIMIILVQSSFIIYSLLGDISSGLTRGVLELVPNSFFELSSDYGVAMSFAFGGAILVSVLLSIILSGLQIIGMYAGILLFPLGIFLYYFTPTKGFGKLLLLLSVGIMFITFIQSIILLIASSIGLIIGFQGNQALLLFIGISSYNFFTLLLIIYLLFRAAVSVLNSDAGKMVRVVT